MGCDFCNNTGLASYFELDENLPNGTYNFNECSQTGKCPEGCLIMN